MSGILVIYSGGADSTTLLYDLIDKGLRVDAISFNYGQRHSKELDCARAICANLGITHDVIEFPDFGKLCKSKSKLLGGEIPEGHYEEESMKQTVVPNRNMMMLSIAAGIAITRGYNSIAFGAHSGDHAIYPDCRQPFVIAMMDAINEGNWLDCPFVVYAPYIGMSKGDIFKLGKTLGVPYEQTWTCYKGLDEPCGLCGSCVERLEAEKEAGI